MDKERWIITVRVNGTRIFSQEINTVPIGGVSMTEVPPGIIDGHYAHLQIEFHREGEKK